MRRSAVLLVHHLPEADGGILDVEVLLPRGPDLGGVQAAAVNPLEVAIREFVPGLGVLGRLVVHTEVPVGVLVPAAGLDELVLRFGRLWCSLQSSLWSSTTWPCLIWSCANSWECLFRLVVMDSAFYLDGGIRAGRGRPKAADTRTVISSVVVAEGRSRASAGSSRLCPAIPLARTIWSPAAAPCTWSARSGPCCQVFYQPA